MGTANRPATAAEIARMQGAGGQGDRRRAPWGSRAGLIYIPGTYSNTEEVVALARALPRSMAASTASHMRDEGEHVLQGDHRRP